MLDDKSDDLNARADTDEYQASLQTRQRKKNMQFHASSKSAGKKTSQTLNSKNIKVNALSQSQPKKQLNFQDPRQR